MASLQKLSLFICILFHHHSLFTNWLVWWLQLLSLQIYLKCVKKLYRVGLETVNFKKASDQARQLINSWVEKQTEGKVREEFEI